VEDSEDRDAGGHHPSHWQRTGTSRTPSRAAADGTTGTGSGRYLTLWDLHDAGDWRRAGHSPPFAALQNAVEEVPDDPDWVR
jgi:hypothetical protein